MPIHRPGSRLMRDIPLKFVGGKHSHRGKKSPNTSLNLTSMIDFLTVVVIFLLMSFSASGEISAITKGLELPQAANTRALERAPMVVITRDVVTLDVGGTAHMIGGVAPLMREGITSDNWRIEGLIEDLGTVKANWGMMHPGEPFPAAVVVQADRTTNFRVLKKIMFSCAQSGFTNIALLVNKSAENKPAPLAE